MKWTKKTITAILIAVICGCPITSRSQTIAISGEAIPSDMARTGSTVYAEAIGTNKYAVRIYNPTKQPVYLFSSYLYGDFFASKYLHLYSKKDNTCTLSFLPLPYFLSYTRSDNLIFGPNAVVNKYQITYQFLMIPPSSYIDINLPLTCFDGDYIQNYQPQKLSLQRPPVFKAAKRPATCTKQMILFAIYTDIDNLNKDTYYKDYYAFSKDILDYHILSVKVD